MNRVAEVNRELRRHGIDAKLTRGRGYYYFRGPEVEKWPQQSVMVFRADALSVERWMAEFRLLRNRALGIS